jgi:hypothetical protein
VRGEWLRRRVVRIAAASLTLASAGIGIALLLAPNSVSVSMSERTYRIGDASLHAVAPGVYSGDGALVINRSGQDVVAGGSAVVDGKLWAGFCDLTDGGTREACLLRQGSQALTASDTWSDGAWRRTYSDGKRITFAAPAGVPAPFPVGR